MSLCCGNGGYSSHVSFIMINFELDLSSRKGENPPDLLISFHKTSVVCQDFRCEIGIRGGKETTIYLVRASSLRFVDICFLTTK